MHLEIPLATHDEVVVPPAKVVSASFNGSGFVADERYVSGSAIDESQKANRAKHGK